MAIHNNNNDNDNDNESILRHNSIHNPSLDVSALCRIKCFVYFIPCTIQVRSVLYDTSTDSYGVQYNNTRLAACESALVRTYLLLYVHTCIVQYIQALSPYSFFTSRLAQL